MQDERTIEQLSDYIDTSVLLCRCGCGADVSDATKWLLLSQIEFVQRRLNDTTWRPKINSGARCLKHNKDIGGTPNSAHLSLANRKGGAIDQGFSSIYEMDVINSWLGGVIDCKRKKVYFRKRFIHWDNLFGKPLPFPKIAGYERYGRFIRYAY